jgi:triosephosphate isomerase
MRRKFIAGNWKMFKGPQEARQLAKSLKIKLTDVRRTEVVVCPPFVSISAVQEILRDSRIAVGAQNVHLERSGAYTGEVSAPMLKDAGCLWVIIGHSERRQYYGETDDTVNRKIRLAVADGLSPIVCIGETLSEREGGQTEQVINRQFSMCFNDLSEDVFGRVVIAYEPVWAIGTGRNATPEQADAVHRQIRALAASRYGRDAAELLRIQYGGSVKPENAADLLQRSDIDGALVGGASLDADAFTAIVRAAEDVP